MGDLRGFVSHGVVLTEERGTQAVGTCPFCHKEGHFYVNLNTRQWDCKRCGLTGGWRTFLTETAKRYAEALTPAHMKRIAAARGLPISAFQNIGLGWDGDMFTLAVRDETPGVLDIRRWRPPKGVMLSTPSAKVGLWNGNQLAQQDRKTEPVYICEGEWDAIALQWMLCKLGERGVVIGAPGANTFKREWVPLFSGRPVTVLYDNDEAGEAGELLTMERLSGTAKSIQWLHWPEALPLKFDVRDFIIEEAIKKGKPRAAWRKMQLLFKPYPRRKAKGNIESEPPPQPTSGTTVSGPVTRDTVIAGYKKWLHLDEPTVLDVMFGVCFANRLEGDPVWLFLVAPPGGSKTELLMSLSKSDNIETTTSLTPHALVSGAVWTSGADPSLIPKLNGKVLIIKDFTTILKMHFTARDEIFGILRDAYDGKTEKIFGTGIKRSYESKFGILAGVTPAIDSFMILQASLGERFLKWRISDSLDHVNEKETIRRALSNINKEVNMRDQIADVAAACLAMDMPEQDPVIPPEIITKLIALSRIVAAMRGVVERDRYNGSVMYKPTTEIGTRLAKQLAKVAMGVAIFRGIATVTDNEYEVSCKVARDTCPDRVEDIIRTLWVEGDGGELPVPTSKVAAASNLPQATVFRLLADFELLKLVRRLGSMSKAEWILSAKIRKLINEAKLYPHKEEQE